MDKKRNVTVTSLSRLQYEWLQKKAEEKALTLTAVVKMLIERARHDEKSGGFWS